MEFVIIANTAHFPMLEDAPTEEQRIREFLLSIYSLAKSGDLPA
ncbi:hypothetical protein [Kamptonema sp. UHCC 0994]|nr:hypothetical protein [Kamptonema sp. UHCC 0994]MDF0554713.1 hypothetical protein [Kamptonema sp. UHCC 0994]